jgi:hypothetical protein
MLYNQGEHWSPLAVVFFVINKSYQIYQCSSQFWRNYSTLVQLYNPQNIADKQNRAADETLLVPAALGELTNEQIRNLADFFNNGPPLILNPAEKRGPLRKADYSTLVLATEGDIFKLIAADPKKAYEVGIKHPAKYNDFVSNLSLMQQAANLASLDSLLGMEGNDGRDDPFIKPYIDHLQELGVVDPNTGKTVTGPLEYIKAHLDENGNIIYEPLWTNLQKLVLVISP